MKVVLKPDTTGTNQIIIEFNSPEEREAFFAAHPKLDHLSLTIERRGAAEAIIYDRYSNVPMTPADAPKIIAVLHQLGVAQPVIERFQSQMKLMQAGRAAIDYAHQYAKQAATATSLTMTEAQPIWEKVWAMRKREVSLHETLLHLHRIPANDLPQLSSYLKERISLRGTKESQVGNCGELARTALNYLRKNNVNAEAMWIYSENSSQDTHGVVVIGRNPSSDLAKPDTWGDEVLICDPLENSVYPVAEIRQRLGVYKTDPQNEAHPNQKQAYSETYLFKQDTITTNIANAQTQQKIIAERAAILQNLSRIVPPTVTMPRITAAELSQATNNDIERRTFKPIRQMLKSVKSDDYSTMRKLLQQRISQLVQELPADQRPEMALYITNNVLAKLSSQERQHLLDAYRSELPNPDQQYCTKIGSDKNPEAAFDIAVSMIPGPELAIQMPLTRELPIEARLYVGPTLKVRVDLQYFQDENKQLYWQRPDGQRQPVASISTHVAIYQAKLYDAMQVFQDSFAALKIQYPEASTQLEVLQHRIELAVQLSEAVKTLDLTHPDNSHALSDIVTQYVGEQQKLLAEQRLRAKPPEKRRLGWITEAARSLTEKNRDSLPGDVGDVSKQARERARQSAVKTQEGVTADPDQQPTQPLSLTGRK